MYFTQLIRKLFLRDPAGNGQFANYLNRELLKSELLRSNILIGLFSLLAVGILIPPLFGFRVFGTYSDIGNLPLYFIGFYAGVVLYELFIRFLVKTAYQEGKGVSDTVRYGNAFEEASIPTIGIIIVAQVIDPVEVLLGPGSFLYFVFITLSALRLDFRLSVFTGLVAATEYWAITSIFLLTSASPESLSLYMQGSVYPKCLILLLTGLIMGIVTLEIKKRIRTSFKFMQDQNQILEEKVKQRTKELEELNRELKSRVEKEVKKSRENEQLLVQQSKMSAMGEMISMIAHQWRQPLSSIGTVVGNLQVRYDLNLLEQDEFKQAIVDINDQIHYLSTTITDFRKFLSPTKKLESAEFGDIVNNSLKIIGKSLDNKNIKLERSYSYNQELMTYPNELMQVIITILKNAQDALLERKVDNPLIRLSGSESNERLEFMIDDNAGGIPDGLLQKIFEPYFTTKAASDGTGLGLYMSKTIIERHCNGKLSVLNGKNGACFKIDLPLRTIQAVAALQ